MKKLLIVLTILTSTHFVKAQIQKKTVTLQPCGKKLVILGKKVHVYKMGDIIKDRHYLVTDNLLVMYEVSYNKGKLYSYERIAYDLEMLKNSGHKFQIKYSKGFKIYRLIITGKGIKRRESSCKYKLPINKINTYIGLFQNRADAQALVNKVKSNMAKL